MRNASGTTDAGSLTMPVSWQEFEALEEAVEAAKGSDELLSAINKRIQKQGATQGGKGAVRDAMVAAEKAGFAVADMQTVVDEGEGYVDALGLDGPDEALDGLLKAVRQFQESAAGYIVGQTRSSVGGLTKAASARGGQALAEELGEDEFRSMLIDRFGEERAEEILSGNAK